MEALVRGGAQEATALVSNHETKQYFCAGQIVFDKNTEAAYLLLRNVNGSFNYGAWEVLTVVADPLDYKDCEGTTRLVSAEWVNDSTMRI